MLHSSFWHHSTLDLDLSVCWPTLLQPLPVPNTTARDSRDASIPQSTHQDPLFLDFLYPAQTLALMRRLSSINWEAWKAQQMRLRTNTRVRHFSSRAPRPANEQGDNGTSPDAESPFEASDQTIPFEDISPMSLGDWSNLDLERLSRDDEIDKKWLTDVENPLETLRSLLDAGEPDSRLVWSLWQKIDVTSRTPDLSVAVLDYLSSVRPLPGRFAEEVVTIFDALDIKDRRPSSYRGAVRAYLSQSMLGRAALVHKHGVEFGHAAHGNIGTSDLLAHIIRKEKWQLAVEVYTDVVSRRGPMREYWSLAQKNQEMQKHIESFLRYFRRMRHLTGRYPEEQDHIRAFASEFGIQAIGKYAPHSSDSTEERLLYRLVMRLKQSDFLEPRHYEHAILCLLGSSSVQRSSVIPLVVRKLYTTYMATAKADRNVVPSEELFHSMLFALTRSMTKAHGTRLIGPRITVGNVVMDATTFHRRLKNRTLEILMDSYARIGDVPRTRSWYRQIPVPQRKAFHMEFMLEAYAKRGETDRAREWFDSIKQKLGRDPHLRSWNMLLHGFARNDDIVGASKVFDELTSSSIKPDAYSFTALLDLMSQRGDVDGVKDMLALAADVDENIIRSTAVAGYLVTALINNDDMETAELVAKQLQKRKESEQMEGSLTPVWNNIATAYALRRDVASTRRIYEQMTADNIEPNEFTYAALLQALCMVRNPDAAWKILRLVIPQKPVKQLALHYAIVMAGYINQGKYEKVPFVDMHRKSQGVRPSISTRIAAAKAVVLSEHAGRYRKDINQELSRTEAMLRHLLAGYDRWEYTAEPQTGLGFRRLDQADGAYMDIIIEIYGVRGAYDMVDRLLGEYMDRYRDNRLGVDAPLPLRMVVALMTAHFKAERYDEVEKLWNLSLQQAARITQLSTPKAATHPDNKAAMRTSNAPARRHLLSRPLIIYLRTLHFQGRYNDAQRTISELLAEDYTLDNLAWNLYVQLLARTGRIALAFALCEKYLMPNWVGWRKKDEFLRRRYKRTRGWDYMNVNPNLTKPNVNMPQYRTMVILAAAMKYVRRLEAVGGVRVNTTGEAPLSEAVLVKRSPRTVAALQSMPHIDDDLQRRYLGDD
ncbi:hypothetical protein MPH_08757 [Macrophomina phaseolina MS6]|uniref:Tetratricopeptide-like helical n=2 Tax=Macrophomina phaseolina TaxID=35725 RepID=K2SAW0_MACPH|nr:hypothetical protein MPH_08757 [Macrophomina phaseolina MS6]